MKNFAPVSVLCAQQFSCCSERLLVASCEPIPEAEILLRFQKAQASEKKITKHTQRALTRLKINAKICFCSIDVTMCHCEGHSRGKWYAEPLAPTQPG